jgi:hypothetical protein
MVIHACIPALGRLRWEDCEFEGSLGCIARLSQKTKAKIKTKNQKNQKHLLPKQRNKVLNSSFQVCKNMFFS